MGFLTTVDQRHMTQGGNLLPSETNAIVVRVLSQEMVFSTIIDRISTNYQVEIVVLRLLYAVGALLVFQCMPARATDQNCMSDYYRTKSQACIDATLSPLRQAGPRADPSTIFGFLAQLFIASRAERQRILKDEPSDYVRAISLVALYRAGLFDEARSYADKVGQSALLTKLETEQLKPLAEVRPSSVPADNDLLIGAYMASGDTVFIERILANFSSADDGLAGDALRMGLMQSKFGPKFAPPNRKPQMPEAACTKYQCKFDRTNFMRLVTLSTAFWALESLARNDEGIKKTFSNFFERNPRLRDMLRIELVALGNYTTAVLALAALGSDRKGAEAEQAYADMNKAAMVYETFGPARDMLAPLETPPKAENPRK